MAPEARGGEVEARYVYALGCVLFEILPACPFTKAHASPTSCQHPEREH
jgi:hypothetical protein